MSLWRREASKRLPELQAKISSPLIYNASDLWIELHLEFDRLCREEPAPTALLARIWEYAKWSSNHENREVQMAVMNHFFEHIEDTRVYRTVLPTFMTREEYEQSCGLRVPKTE